MTFMKVPDQFFKYFALVTLALLIGIGLVVLQSAVTRPAPAPYNASEVKARYEFYVTF
jgi:hypothetical protein